MLYQADLIGRVFADWAIVFFGQFYEMTKVVHIVGLLFFSS
jgi:hypothetical protein